VIAKWKGELRATFHLAAPLAIAHAGMQLMGLVDTAVVGRLGATQLGAVGIANALFFFIGTFGVGIVMGVDPLIAQAFGSGARIRARLILWQGVWLASICGAVLSVPMILSPAMLPLIGVDKAIASEATAYLVVRTFSLVPLLVYFVIRGYLQARLVTRPIVWSMIIGNVFNLVADIVLVHGGQGLPAWTGPLRWMPSYGIVGAGIASVAGSLLGLWILADGVRRLEIDLSDVRHRALAPVEFAKAFRVGLPAGLHLGAEVGIFALVALLAGRLGESDLAAHQIAISLAAMTFTVVMGISAAASVRVGHAIGSRDIEGTRRAGLVSVLAGALFMFFCAILFWTFPRQLASLFTGSPEVIATAVPLLFVAAIFQISDGIQGVSAGALRGAGDTTFTFLASLVGHWFVGFPVALGLGFGLGMGIVGLWWGLSAGLTAVAAILLVRFMGLSAAAIEPL